MRPPRGGDLLHASTAEMRIPSPRLRAESVCSAERVRSHAWCAGSSGVHASLPRLRYGSSSHVGGSDAGVHRKRERHQIRNGVCAKGEAKNVSQVQIQESLGPQMQFA